MSSYFQAVYLSKMTSSSLSFLEFEERDCWSRIPPWVAAELEQVLGFFPRWIEVEEMLFVKFVNIFAHVKID